MKVLNKFAILILFFSLACSGSDTKGLQEEKNESKKVDSQVDEEPSSFEEETPPTLEETPETQPPETQPDVAEDDVVDEEPVTPPSPPVEDQRPTIDQLTASSVCVEPFETVTLNWSISDSNHQMLSAPSFSETVNSSGALDYLVESNTDFILFAENNFGSSSQMISIKQKSIGISYQLETEISSFDRLDYSISDNHEILLLESNGRLLKGVSDLREWNPPGSVSTWTAIDQNPEDSSQIFLGSHGLLKFTLDGDTWMEQPYYFRASPLTIQSLHYSLENKLLFIGLGGRTYIFDLADPIGRNISQKDLNTEAVLQFFDIDKGILALTEDGKLFQGSGSHSNLEWSWSQIDVSDLGHIYNIRYFNNKIYIASSSGLFSSGLGQINFKNEFLVDKKVFDILFVQEIDPRSAHESMPLLNSAYLLSDDSLYQMKHLEPGAKWKKILNKTFLDTTRLVSVDHQIMITDENSLSSLSFDRVVPDRCD